MKKKITLLIAIILCTVLLAGCQCEHEWVDAACTSAKVCNLCGEIEGEPLGHSWTDATCVTPMTCNICNETQGEALPHQWTNATCSKPKTCTSCGQTREKPLEHKYATIEVLELSTCTSQGKQLQKCALCGKENIKLTAVLQHTYQSTVNQCTTTNICKVCNYTKTTVKHKSWYFTSNYYIEYCYIDDLSFSGTVTCKVCHKTKSGRVEYSAEEFEKIFCSWVNYGNYDDIARYPEENKNYVMKFTGYILQDCGNNLYRMSTNGRYDDVIMVEFKGQSDGRILEDDRVTVFGEPDLLYTYTSTSGAKITIPKFIAYYIHR